MFRYLLMSCIAAAFICIPAAAYFPTAIPSASIATRAQYPRQVLLRGQVSNMFYNPAAVTAKPRTARMQLKGSGSIENWIPELTDVYAVNAYASASFDFPDTNRILAVGGYFASMNYGEMERALSDGTEWYTFRSSEYFFNGVAGIGLEQRLHLGVAGKIIYSDLFPGDEITPAAQATTVAFDIGAQSTLPLPVSEGLGAELVLGGAVTDLGPALVYEEEPKHLGTAVCIAGGLRGTYLRYAAANAGAGWGWSLNDTALNSECIQAGGDLTLFTVVNVNAEYRIFSQKHRDPELVTGLGLIFDLCAIREFFAIENTGTAGSHVTDRLEFNVVFKYFKDFYGDEDIRGNPVRMKLDIELSNFGT